MLGLGLRAGRVVIGVDATRAVMQRGDAMVIVLASDASPRAVEKVVRLAQGTKVPIVPGPAAQELGGRLGRPPVMVVAVRDRGLAAGILALTPDRDGT